LDYNIWKANFGKPNGSIGSGSLAGVTQGAVPEPASWMLCAVGLAIYAAKRRSR
jgi:hypothetical protein